jgi:hypothetical protein
MSAADDALRDMAQNRGCKLVASRVRTPGKGDYGRYGLRDANTGKDVFGFGKRGVTGTPEEIERFLRGDATATWKASAGSIKRKPKEARAPAPRPEPKLVLREALPKDAAAMAALIGALGYDVTPADIKRRLAALNKGGEPPLVAELGAFAGVLTWHVTPVLHRPRPVGRITMLVIAEACAGRASAPRWSRRPKSASPPKAAAWSRSPATRSACVPTFSTSASVTSAPATASARR